MSDFDISDNSSRPSGLRKVLSKPIWSDVGGQPFDDETGHGREEEKFKGKKSSRGDAAEPSERENDESFLDVMRRVA